MIVTDRDHQHATPFDDRTDIENLPEELRQVARRYATLRVPQPTSEETNRLIARLQTSAGQDISDLPVRSPRRPGRARPLLEVLAAVLMVSILIGSFLLVLSLRSHRSPASSATPVASPTRSTPAGLANPLQTIHMINVTTGWALTSTSVLYTTNGWSTWKDITPHKADLVGAGYFLSGEEAWISEASGLSLQAGQKPAVIVSHTTNGGRTWQSATLSVPVPDGVFSMSFINDQDGWAEAELGGAFGNDLEELFRTTDGGKSWVAVSSNGFVSQDHIPNTFPYGGHATGITFINASTGWVVNTSKLYVTHDGGATWRQQTLPTAPDQGFALPTFFNAREGILPGGSQFFITQDGGTTWQPGPLLPQSSGFVTFTDRQHGWAAVDNGTTLYRTSDGGAHWAKITPAIAASIISVVQLNFVSTETGWALGYTSQPPNTLLFKTADGGETWTQVLFGAA
jgi:photosystem II stability/assembly factor-like uncharacterized protein